MKWNRITATSSQANDDLNPKHLKHKNKTKSWPLYLQPSNTNAILTLQMCLVSKWHSSCNLNSQLHILSQPDISTILWIMLQAFRPFYLPTGLICKSPTLQVFAFFVAKQVLGLYFHLPSQHSISVFPAATIQCAITSFTELSNRYDFIMICNWFQLCILRNCHPLLHSCHLVHLTEPWNS